MASWSFYWQLELKMLGAIKRRLYDYNSLLRWDEMGKFRAPQRQF